MTQSTKDKITKIVKLYMTTYPEEYKAFLKQKAITNYKLGNEWAEIQGDHVFERMLYEVPETLFSLMKVRLSDTEWSEFTTDDKNNKSTGQQWFAKTFPAFRVTKQV